MSQLLYDDEDYYFQISEKLEDDRELILIIYDIVDNKVRLKLSKLLEGYGRRVQKSAFEALLSQKSYNKLVGQIPSYIDTGNCEDNVRIYKLSRTGKITAWGEVPEFEEEVVII